MTTQVVEVDPINAKGTRREDKAKSKKTQKPGKESACYGDAPSTGPSPKESSWIDPLVFLLALHTSVTLYRACVSAIFFTGGAFFLGLG